MHRIFEPKKIYYLYFASRNTLLFPIVLQTLKILQDIQ